MGNNKPVFEREPDKVNELGTKFWNVDAFDHIIEKLPLDNLSVMWSEYTDDEGVDFYGYVIIEGDDVMFETVRKRDVREILETVHQESIDRGLIELEME